MVGRSKTETTSSDEKASRLESITRFSNVLLNLRMLFITFNMLNRFRNLGKII